MRLASRLFTKDISRSVIDKIQNTRFSIESTDKCKRQHRVSSVSVLYLLTYINTRCFEVNVFIHPSGPNRAPDSKLLGTRTESHPTSPFVEHIELHEQLTINDHKGSDLSLRRSRV